MNLDIDVEAIDTRELLDDAGRLAKITDWIIANHDRKTHHRKFTAIFAVSSVDNLIRYYDLFRQRDTTELRIATIFSYTANEEDKAADGMIGEPDFENDGPTTPIPETAWRNSSATTTRSSAPASPPGTARSSTATIRTSGAASRTGKGTMPRTAIGWTSCWW